MSNHNEIHIGVRGKGNGHGFDIVCFKKCFPEFSRNRPQGIYQSDIQIIQAVNKPWLFHYPIQGVDIIDTLRLIASQ